MTSTHRQRAPHDASRLSRIARGIALVLAVGVMSWVLVTRSPAQRSDTIAVPALPQLGARCSADPAHAEHRSRQALRSAIARAERYAFAPQDGLIALERFAEARACAELAGASMLLEEATRRAARHRARVEADYAEHVARYRLARRAERLREAKEDIDFLLDLLAMQAPSGVRQLRLDQLELERQASVGGHN